MFDTFEPFSTLKKQGFSFAASRYEIWRDGLLVDSAKCLTTIIAVVRPIKETVQIEVHLTNADPITTLVESMFFDEIITLHDRIQLINVPDETNIQDIGMQTLKMMIGSTRSQKHFLSGEAYCCNIFQKNKNIAKVTFPLSNPETLVEFYDDRIMNI